MTNNGMRLVLTTVADRTSARDLARRLVDDGLAACVQRVPIESSYRWKGKVEEDAEILLLIKTTAACAAAVEDTIHEISSYEVPEVVVIEAERVGAAYGAWLESACRQKRPAQ